MPPHNVEGQAAVPPPPQGPGTWGWKAKRVSCAPLGAMESTSRGGMPGVSAKPTARPACTQVSRSCVRGILTSVASVMPGLPLWSCPDLSRRQQKAPTACLQIQAGGQWPQRCVAGVPERLQRAGSSSGSGGGRRLWSTGALLQRWYSQQVSAVRHQGKSSAPGHAPGGLWLGRRPRGP